MTYTPTQQTFLGCSICGFNCSFEWSTGGTLTVSLVEDPKNFDELLEPAMGYPARFQYDDYIFDGIINDFGIKRGSGGNRTLEVTLHNPAQILDGVQVIMGGYTGTVATLYNLYNVYGYLESSGFGNSLVNESGILWGTLVETLQTMVDEYPIRFNGVPYYLDLSELPTSLPVYYRIPGNSLSISEIVSELCESCGHDFFWDLFGNVIKLRTINRQLQAGSGRIQEFLDANYSGQAISSDIGYQVEYNNTGRFISGGQVENIYYRASNLQDAHSMAIGDRDEYIANFANISILPFFGLTSDGSVVMPKSLNYTFNNSTGFWETNNFPDLWYVNSNSILGGGLSFPAGYPITVTEMRYALVGQKEWENFITSVSPLDELFIMHQNFNPYKGINDMLELNAEVSKVIKDKLAALSNAKLLKIKPLDVVNLDILDKVMSVKGQRVYEFVRNIATEYFGRKFMVTLPSLYLKRDVDTGIVNTSYEISDSGYVEESLYPNAINNGYIPLDYQFITNTQGKIEAYVKFTGFQAAELNLSGLAPSDYSVYGNNVFVKCEVEPLFVYLNANNLTGPRAVITLPSPVYSTEYDIDTGSAVMIAIRQDWQRRGATVGINEFIQKLVDQIGFDVLRDPIPPIPLIPAMAAIPVRSNVETYGPWYYTGSNGKIEYEQNNDLVPWNFGGYTQMNLIGTSLVTDAISSRFVSEAGSIEVPGAPLARTGAVLITGGPYITGISVTADANNGVTTSYRFNSWNVKPGKLQRYNTERFRQIVDLRRQQKRNLRELFKPKTAILTTQIRLNQPNFNRRLKGNTPHDVIMGENRSYDGIVDSSISIMPFYNAMNATQDNDSYISKGGFTLDGLFRPFSTEVTATEMGHFETPAAQATSPTVDNLNPLQAGHDIGMTMRDITRPNDLRNDGSAGGRGIALRGPIILTGWGYDTNSKPVPNSNPSSPTSSFSTGYLTSSDTWKTGPVDLRWDNDRKVWVTGTTLLIKKFIFQGASNSDFLGNDGITVQSSGLAYQPSNGVSNTQYIIDGAGRNFLIRNDPVMCIFSDGNWYIVGENGLHRSAITNTLISFPEGGNCKLMSNTNVNIQAYFNRLGQLGDIINEDTDVELRYVVEEGGWIIPGAACNDE